MVLKLSKIVYFFFQFSANVSKKSKPFIPTYVHASESSRIVFLENVVGYYAMN